MIKNLDQYLAHIKADYAMFLTGCNAEDSISEFTVSALPGSKYIKIVTESHGTRIVHSFICLYDMGKFTKGDILKPASWNGPARNFARGNVANNNFLHVRWMGA